jgi:hypothetical protein
MPGQPIVIPGDLRTRLFLIFLLLELSFLSALFGALIGASMLRAL